MLTVFLLAATMLPVDRAVTDGLTAPQSPDRERAAYALARLFDPEPKEEPE